MTCKKYNKQYVGRTTTTFRFRIGFNNHKRALDVMEGARGVFAGNICMSIFVKKDIRVWRICLYKLLI